MCVCVCSIFIYGSMIFMMEAKQFDSDLLAELRSVMVESQNSLRPEILHPSINIHKFFRLSHIPVHK